MLKLQSDRYLIPVKEGFVGKIKGEYRMWYAVWVRTGHEEKLLKLCKSSLANCAVMEECFLPKYERAWKENGKWGKKKEILFPGYLFFISEHPQELVAVLREIPEFVKVLGDDDGPIPLYDKEVKFLQKYTNPEHVLEMSTGILVGQQLVITDGPMKDYQGKVVHVDRHKRMATLEVKFFGRVVRMKVGVEVVGKL